MQRRAIYSMIYFGICMAQRPAKALPKRLKLNFVEMVITFPYIVALFCHSLS